MPLSLETFQLESLFEINMMLIEFLIGNEVTTILTMTSKRNKRWDIKGTNKIETSTLSLDIGGGVHKVMQLTHSR